MNELTDTDDNKSSAPFMKIQITRDDFNKITFDHFDYKKYTIYIQLVFVIVVLL